MAKLVTPLYDSKLPATRFKTLWEFYPFYLSQHLDPTCRRLHIIGTTLVIIIMLTGLLTDLKLLLWCPVAGYSFAWIGHFVFEKNRPATFTYPVYSLLSDFVMWYEVLFAGRPMDERRK